LAPKRLGFGKLLLKRGNGPPLLRDLAPEPLRLGLGEPAARLVGDRTGRLPDS